MFPLEAADCTENCAEPSLADNVCTGIKFVVTNLRASAALTEYINFHLYPSAVLKVAVDVPEGSTEELPPLLLNKHLYTLKSEVITYIVLDPAGVSYNVFEVGSNCLYTFPVLQLYLAKLKLISDVCTLLAANMFLH